MVAPKHVVKNCYLPSCIDWPHFAYVYSSGEALDPYYQGTKCRTIFRTNGPPYTAYRWIQHSKVCSKLCDQHIHLRKEPALC